MSLIGSTAGITGPRAILPQPAEMLQGPGAAKPGALEAPGAAGAPAKFEALMDRALNAVEDQQAAASATTRAVLLGDNARLHESMIAMQEASLSLSLMIEVRNKVVESYQELMRLPV